MSGSLPSLCLGFIIKSAIHLRKSFWIPRFNLFSNFVAFITHVFFGFVFYFIQIKSLFCGEKRQTKVLKRKIKIIRNKTTHSNDLLCKSCERFIKLRENILLF